MSLPPSPQPHLSTTSIAVAVAVSHDIPPGKGLCERCPCLKFIPQPQRTLLCETCSHSKFIHILPSATLISTSAMPQLPIIDSKLSELNPDVERDAVITSPRGSGSLSTLPESLLPVIQSVDITEKDPPPKSEALLPLINTEKEPSSKSVSVTNKDGVDVKKTVIAKMQEALLHTKFKGMHAKFGRKVTSEMHKSSDVVIAASPVAKSNAPSPAVKRNDNIPP